MKNVEGDIYLLPSEAAAILYSERRYPKLAEALWPEVTEFFNEHSEELVSILEEELGPQYLGDDENVRLDHPRNDFDFEELDTLFTAVNAVKEGDEVGRAAIKLFLITTHLPHQKDVIKVPTKNLPHLLKYYRAEIIKMNKNATSKRHHKMLNELFAERYRYQARQILETLPADLAEKYHFPEFDEPE